MLKLPIKMYPVFNLGKGNISLINIHITSLVNCFVTYIEYIMEIIMPFDITQTMLNITCSL